MKRDVIYAFSGLGVAGQVLIALLLLLAVLALLGVRGLPAVRPLLVPTDLHVPPVVPAPPPRLARGEPHRALSACVPRLRRRHVDLPHAHPVPRDRAADLVRDLDDGGDR